MGTLFRRTFPCVCRAAVRLALSSLPLLMVLTAQGQARKALVRVPPEYPPLAARMGVTGTVKVAATIEPDGNVAQTHATAGHALLRQAAEKAVLRWKFASAEKSSDMNVDVLFQLDGASTR